MARILACALTVTFLVAISIRAEDKKELDVKEIDLKGLKRDFPKTAYDKPTTITSDGAPGLITAITTCFPASIRIRCWFHRLGNIRAKLPDETAGEVLAHVYAVRTIQKGEQ